MRSRCRGATGRTISLIGALVLARPAAGSELSRQLTGDGTRSLRQIALEAALAIGDPPILYWSLGIALFAVLIATSVAPLFVRPEGGGSARMALVRLALDRRLYGFLVAVAIAGLRWPLLARTLLNTDESHSIACAMKLGVDPVFWRGIDGTTGGPLLFYPLLLPRLLGLPIEYASARAVGMLALIGSVLLLYGTVRRLFDEGIARLAVLPLATCWALTTSNHFAHYSSEQIPVFLITLALYLLVRWWKDPPGSDWTLVLGGVVLGSLPFAKLQAVPVGLFLAVCGLVLITIRFRGSTREKVRRWLVFVASGLAVTVFLLITVAITGVWRDFWQSYVVNNLGYGGRYFLFSDVGMSLAERVGFVVDRSFWTYDLAELVGPTLLIGLLVLLAALIWGRRQLMDHLANLSLAAGLVLASVIAVAFPNTLFTHYYLFLVVPVTLLGAVWLGLAAGMLRARFVDRWRSVALTALVAAFVALTVVRPFDHRLHKQHPVFSRLASIPEVDSSPVAEVVLGLGRAGEPMAVWGWQPWRYVEAGLYPATRDTQTQWQILATPQRPYYQERFKADLARSLPPVFVDTTGYVEDSRSLWRPVFWNREIHAHDAFSEIAAIVERHYRQVGEIGATRIYVSHARLAELELLAGAELIGLESEELLALVPELARLDLGETR